MRRADAELHGVLVVDKPVGPTSHDVVARLRRALGTRRVGHAGTLDPHASGVLVALVGEATKLSPYLTAHDKLYAATIALGTATTTWDAEGEVVARAPLPGDLARELQALAGGDACTMNEGAAPLLHQALTGERQRTMQVPPAFSAIKRDGRPAYALARRGLDIALEARSVEVIALEVVRAEAQSIDVLMRVSKGYYVRAFAQDLGSSLGVPTHLAALRRLASGPFAIEEACTSLADGSSLHAHLQPLAQAARRAMPVAVVTAAGAAKAGHGQLLQQDDFTALAAGSPAAWLDVHGALVAVGAEAPTGGYRSLRGFAQPTSRDET